MNLQKILPFYIYKVSGKSMTPFLSPNQKVVGIPWFIKLKVDDVIVLNSENKLIVKRIIKIKKNELWIEGDNKNESTDSRSFGWIKSAQIVAKVTAKL